MSGRKRKLLLTGDIHFERKYWDWLEKNAEHYQGIAIAGDLCDGLLTEKEPERKALEAREKQSLTMCLMKGRCKKPKGA